MKKNTQYKTLKAKTIEELQKKVQHHMRNGWEPESDIQVDYQTGEVLQTVSKDNKNEKK